jgi:16S rRNA (guanine966-N2)-methyltransferase
MRVVAGELGGRRLTAPRGRATRPTAARTREALFSILGDIAGARVLDLFAGSGALGIEALSRGAANATFVDSQQSAIDAIVANRAALDLERRSVVLHADIRENRWAVSGASYDLVFADPPYASDFGALLGRLLPPVLAPGARVVTESDRRAPLDLTLPLRIERRYGDTLIRIHQARET